MCPLISGSIMDMFDNKLEGLIWGWRSVIIMGLLGPFLFGKALYNEARSITEFNSVNKENHLKIEKRTKAWSVL